MYLVVTIPWCPQEGSLYIQYSVCAAAVGIHMICSHWPLQAARLQDFHSSTWEQRATLSIYANREKNCEKKKSKQLYTYRRKGMCTSCNKVQIHSFILFLPRLSSHLLLCDNNMTYSCSFFPLIVKINTWWTIYFCLKRSKHKLIEYNSCCTWRAWNTECLYNSIYRNLPR